MRYIIFLLSFFLINNESLRAKKINVDGVYYKCKSPKNSFERTRGVKNRICFFSKEDKNQINKRIRDIIESPSGDIYLMTEETNRGNELDFPNLIVLTNKFK